jgi:drug/metabolite transporter (DMT)-like permease
MRSDLRGTIVRFLILAVLWGSGFAFIKIALEGFTPSQIVLGRLWLGAAVLLAIVALSRIPLPRGWAVWGHLAGAALLGNVVPFLLVSYGEQTTGAGIAGVLIGSTPLHTMAFAAAALPTERATRRKVLGLLTGFLGVVIVIGPWHEQLGSLGGQLACLGTAACYGAGYVYARKFLSPRGLAPMALAGSQLLAAAVIQAVVTPFFVWHTPQFTGRTVSSLVILGVLCTGFAFVFYFRIIRDLGATTASSVSYLVPVFAVLTGVLLLDESLSWNLLVGGIVVLAGVAYAENRFTPARRRPAAPAPVPAKLPR